MVELNPLDVVLVAAGVIFLLVFGRYMGTVIKALLGLAIAAFVCVVALELVSQIAEMAEFTQTSSDVGFFQSFMGDK